MEHDEHEMLIEYSEMTAYSLDSEEFQEVKKDYLEWKKKKKKLSAWFVKQLIRFASQMEYREFV